MMFSNKLSKKERRGLVIAVTFVFLAFSDRVIIKPINDKIQQSNREIEINERKLARYLHNLRQKEVIDNECREYIQHVQKTDSDEEEASKIFEEIEELSRKSHVYLIDIKPLSPQEIDSHREYRVEIEVEGEMESMVDFLYQLNNSKQLFRAEKLSLNLKKKDSPVIKASVLITKILIL